MTSIAYRKSFEQLPSSKTAYLEQISLVLVDGACLMSVKEAQSRDFTELFCRASRKIALKIKET